MNKEKFEEYLNLALATGADFAEIYYEESKNTTYRLNDSKLDTIDTAYETGIGIRITKNDDSYYTSTNILSDDNIKNIIVKLTNNINSKSKKSVRLDKLIDKCKYVKMPHDKYPICKKKEILYKIDNVARKTSNLVKQVSAGILEMYKTYSIANSKGKYIKSNNTLTRIYASVFVERDGNKEHNFVDCAASTGYELLGNFKLEEEIIKATKIAVEKLDSKDFKGGELPVVIAPGFGAVIFHESCGHGLEATSVAPRLSVFSNDMNKKIASDKVTLIDDGTIEKAWGSFTIDDEGNKSRKNILIEKGILRNYLVDNYNSKKMKCKSNGCGRRESYKYSATSRMSNTYLAPGNDSVDDMIKSIKLGVYCERLTGGSVNPATGDFNFAVSTARLIENGKIKHLLKGITLIGNSKEILKNVEMVSDDLLINAGFCGSKSGMIPVTIGQPTIKVSKILVGGKE